MGVSQLLGGTCPGCPSKSMPMGGRQHYIPPACEKSIEPSLESVDGYEQHESGTL